MDQWVQKIVRMQQEQKPGKLRGWEHERFSAPDLEIRSVVHRQGDQEYAENIVYANPTSVILSIARNGEISVRKQDHRKQQTQGRLVSSDQWARTQIGEAARNFTFLGEIDPWGKYLSQDCTVYVDVPLTQIDSREASTLKRNVDAQIVKELQIETDHSIVAALFKLKLWLEARSRSGKSLPATPLLGLDRRFHGVPAAANGWMKLENNRIYSSNDGGKNDHQGHEAVGLVLLDRNSRVAYAKRLAELLSQPEMAEKANKRGFEFPTAIDITTNDLRVAFLLERRSAQNAVAPNLIGGGIIAGMTAEQTFESELTQETMMVARGSKSVSPLVTGYAAPEILSTRTSIFLAEQAEIGQLQEVIEAVNQRDEIFRTDTVMIPLQDLVEKIANGELHDSRMISALAALFLKDGYRHYYEQGIVRLAHGIGRRD